jgi:probable phosphoglycerate mutase
MATPKGAVDKRCQIVLLRHAHSTANLKGILAGRDNTVGLSERGQSEARSLIQTLSQYSFDAIYVSDLKRCKETIAPYLAHSGKKAERSRVIMEMDYGRWSGKPLKKLSTLPLWNLIQSRPSLVRFPDGESFSEMHLRANQGVIDMTQGKKCILVVSHGDVIKSIVAHHLGLPLDNFQRISIDPASITRIMFPSSQVISMNDTSHLRAESASKDLATKRSLRRDEYSLGGGAGQI